VARRGPLGQHRQAPRQPDPGGAAPRRPPAPLLRAPARLDVRVRQRRLGRAGAVGAVRGRDAAAGLGDRPTPRRHPARLAVHRGDGHVAVRAPLRHGDADVRAAHGRRARPVPPGRRRRAPRPPRVAAPRRPGRAVRAPAADALLVDLAARVGRARVGVAVVAPPRGPPPRRPGLRRYRRGKPAVRALDPVLPLPGGPHGHAVGRAYPADHPDRQHHPSSWVP
jgi:hypothetical protein